MPGGDHRLDLPGELVRPQRSAAEVRAGGERDPGLRREPHAVLGLLAPLGDALAALVGVAKRSRCVVRLKVCHECSTASVDTSVTPFAASARGRVGVEVEAVLEAVDAGLGADAGAGQHARVRGDRSLRARARRATAARTSATLNGAVSASGPSR